MTEQRIVFCTRCSPIPTAEIRLGVVPHAIADYGQDVILNTGTGIMDHPDGPAAGVQAFFEALEYFQAGRSFQLEQVVDRHWHRALQKWGTP